jgi:hypothetical protein
MYPRLVVISARTDKICDVSTAAADSVSKTRSGYTTTCEVRSPVWDDRQTSAVTYEDPI